MNLLEIIYIIGALAVGFIVGMIVEMAFEASTIYKQRETIRQLRQTVYELSQRTPVEYVEYYEVTDKSVDPENVPNYSQDW